MLEMDNSSQDLWGDAKLRRLGGENPPAIKRMEMILKKQRITGMLKKMMREGGFKDLASSTKFKRTN